MKPALTAKQQRFVEEYLVDLNATQAAIRAGYSPKTAGIVGHENLKKPNVAEAVATAQKARAERTEITQDAVLQQLWGVACADPGNLVQFRRCCCRYCWGQDYRYQRTTGEFEADFEAHERVQEMAQLAGKPVVAFDPKGGIGYDKRKGPNPECPECFGEGIGYTYVHDTRNLPREARLLYAGVKETKEGFEVKMHSPMEARQMIGRHLGMFKDKVELGGPNGGPIPLSDVKLTPEERAKLVARSLTEF